MFADGATLPARILAMANNMPALLQLFGEALTAHLTAQPVPEGGPPQLVTEADVDAVFADADLRAAYRDKYVLTLNLDHRYLVIAYAIAAAAAGHRGRGSGNAVLRSRPAGRPVGVRRRLLQASYGDAARAPLTERQLGRLFDAHREVLAISGSTALGGNGVLAAIDAVVRLGAWRGTLTRCHTATPDGIRAAVAKAAADATLMLADVRNLPSDALAAVFAAAEAAVQAAPVDVTVGVVVGPGNAPVWIRRSARIDLIRVDEPGLRLWCDEANLPFRDEESRARLAAVTGCWPRVIAHTATLAAASSPAPSSARLLEENDLWLAGTGGDRLISDAGIGAEHPTLRAVFMSAAYLAAGRGEELHVLVSLLEMDDDVDLHGLARESGFTGIGEVVDVLMALGCLAVTSDGTVRAEPALAAAVARQAAPTGAEA